MIFVYIAAGGAIGSVLRYFVMTQATHLLGINFPYGTLFVNIVGSCMMGILIGYFAKTLSHSMEMRAFLAVGLLGGFTTFSAFSLDVVTMIERGAVLHAGLYALSSVVLSVLAVFAGIYLIRVI